MSFDGWLWVVSAALDDCTGGGCVWLGGTAEALRCQPGVADVPRIPDVMGEYPLMPAQMDCVDVMGI